MGGQSIQNLSFLTERSEQCLGNDTSACKVKLDRNINNGLST